MSLLGKDLLKFLEIMGEPLGCGQIQARIPHPAHRNCHKDDNSHESCSKELKTGPWSWNLRVHGSGSVTEPAV